jgi:hypothetical protein
MEQSVRLAGVPTLAILCCLFATAPAHAQVRLRGEAYSGQPFGVGRVEVEVHESLLPEVLGTDGLGVTAKDNRVLYPAVERRPLLGAVKGLLSESKRPAVRIFGEFLDRPGRTNVYFLFVGESPLELSVQSRRIDGLTIAPRANPAGHRRLLAAWWRHYNAEPGLFEQKPDYPPFVENYLRAMLARRLGIRLPARPKPQSWHERLAGELGLAADTESLRLVLERERFLGPSAASEPADRPLPEPVATPELEIPEPAKDVAVEPLALRVPAECLYVRFGSFNNFLWFQDTLARWGGDFQNLIATRGLDTGTRNRFETQLAVETTVLARLLGDTLVADVAIVGTDLFIKEGGAYGLLFQARSSLLLGSDFKRQRQERVKKIKGVTEQTVEIAGQKVSYLSSPDGSVRSYYAADGDYHFVTTSKTLARRFLETRSGKGSLGASKEFRHARWVMPLSRKDTVFVYLSSGFFGNLTSPAYRVEMVRRVEALADIELVQLALLASATEGKPGDAIEQLVQGGFLPPGFGPRADGSRAAIAGGEVRDSLRGQRGAFTPIPDVQVTAVSRHEAETFREFAQFYQSTWERLDPVLVGIRREPRPDSRERIVADLRMTPFSRKHFETVSQRLGAPEANRLAPIPADSVDFELVLARQRLFGGLQFIGPGMEVIEGRMLPLGRLKNLVVGYLGTDGELGWLGLLLPQGKVGLVDRAAPLQEEPKVWSDKFDRFRVFSFHREVIQEVIPQLRFEKAERPAQIRLRAVDLSNARITPFLNSWGYSRTRQTSVGNLRLLHQIGQQLHVPGDQARAAAELLLDAKLICPLGGQYVYRQPPEGVGYWTSTALEKGSGVVFGPTPANSALPRSKTTPDPDFPKGYRAPPLNWFRGLELDAAVQPGVVSAHAQIDMQLPDKKETKKPAK